jgi:hypothetical protein
MSIDYEQLETYCEDTREEIANFIIILVKNLLVFLLDTAKIFTTTIRHLPK